MPYKTVSELDPEGNAQHSREWVPDPDPTPEEIERWSYEQWAQDQADAQKGDGK